MTNTIDYAQIARSILFHDHIGDKRFVVGATKMLKMMGVSYEAHYSMETDDMLWCVVNGFTAFLDY